MRALPAWLILIVSLSACREPSPADVAAEARALRAAFERHRAVYLKSIDAENALAAETLLWLNGPVASRGRAALASECRRFMEQWARVYFMPREIHADLRGERFASAAVRQAHERILTRLKRKYFELHDYQRYAQYTSESGFRDAPAGRMPPQLAEMRLRLESRPPARDEISDLLADLP